MRTLVCTCDSFPSTSMFIRIMPLIVALVVLAACDTTGTNPDNGTAMSSDGFMWSSSVASSSSSVASYVEDGCQIGGCSSQLCVNEGEDVMSTCEWRDAYACYRTARCEKQASGTCGWSRTDELLTCIAAAETATGTMTVQ